MSFLILKNLFYEWFISGVYNQNFEDRTEGGPTCYNELKFTYRLNTNILIVIKIIIYKYFQNNSEKLRNNAAPNTFEKILAFLCLLIIPIQFFYKKNIGRALFLFNPCHITLCFEIYLLFSKSNKINHLVCCVMMRFIFGGWLGIIFPVLNGLDQPYEITMFYIEHYLVALILPLGFSMFSLYQRVFLFSIAESTWVNLNFVLCHCDGDPFYPFVNDYYYILSEFYLSFGSFCITVLLKTLETFIDKIINIKLLKKNKLN